MLVAVHVAAKGLPEKECPETGKAKPPGGLHHVVTRRRDPKFKLFRAKGCVNCDYVGYNGRTGLYEMVSVDEGIRDLVLESATALTLRRYCRKHLGMMTLREAALMKAVQGTTTPAEVLYHTDSYED